MTTPTAPSRIIWATTFAAITAAAVLVVAVLPAEYGIDPLGTGRALGLSALANPPAPPPTPQPTGVAASQKNLQTDVFEIELRPFDSVEYKYRLEGGDGLVYAWSASADVTYDFHGEPDGSRPKEAESYSKGTATAASGTFTAGKPGIHGWYWKNNGAGRVKVTLRTSGFYSRSITFYDGDRVERLFEKR
jgi:hypothetical protein